jgi:outer membrane protein assembly factor BamA
VNDATNFPEMFRISLLIFLSCLFINSHSKQHWEATDFYPVGDSIVINAEDRPVGSFFIVDSIKPEGNKITKDRIIFRELTFKAGDTISTDSYRKKLVASRQNLLNTSLFNFVTITDTVLSGGDYSRVQINLIFVERWYIWPFPIFEISDRNFNTWWKDKNFDRISYGFYLIKENNRGRMESLRLLLRFGYDERYELFYRIPYINKKQTFGAGFGAGWMQNHEVAYSTVKNKHVFVKDDDRYLFRNYYFYFNFNHRPSLYEYHQLQLKLNHYSFGDTVLKLNPDYSFEGNRKNEYLTVNYRYTIDYRDSKVYPLGGSYFSGSLNKSGFGIMKDGNIGMMELTGAYRKYWNLGVEIFASTDWTGKISTNRNQPYFYQQGLGFDRNFVRGYELYVIDGQSFVLSKNTLKFPLVKPQVGNIGFIRSEKFGKIHYALYLNWFFDAGYVEAFGNYDTEDLANSLLLGTGFGLDLVTYYDMVFRFEASLNRKGEAGFFVHLKNTL